jgi:hypothetical protein
MTNGFKLFQGGRPKNGPALDRMPADEFTAQVEVTEGEIEGEAVEVPHVFKEHRVTLKGEPLTGLAIVDIVPRAWK